VAYSYIVLAREIDSVLSLYKFEIEKHQEFQKGAICQAQLARSKSNFMYTLLIITFFKRFLKLVLCLWRLNRYKKEEKLFWICLFLASLQVLFLVLLKVYYFQLDKRFFFLLSVMFVVAFSISIYKKIVLLGTLKISHATLEGCGLKQNTIFVSFKFCLFASWILVLLFACLLFSLYIDEVFARDMIVFLDHRKEDVEELLQIQELPKKKNYGRWY